MTIPISRNCLTLTILTIPRLAERALTMSFVLHTDPVPLRVDAHGVVRVGNSRVLLDLVLAAFEAGASPEAIVEDYSTLELADVYATIAYYLRHREEVRAYLQRREQEATQVREMIERHQPDPADRRARMLARRAQMDQPHAP